jgi:hypothetical protein
MENKKGNTVRFTRRCVECRLPIDQNDLYCYYHFHILNTQSAIHKKQNNQQQNNQHREQQKSKKMYIGFRQPGMKLDLMCKEAQISNNNY